MIIQKAAYEILKEKGYPLSYKEIARIALEQGVVTSAARDPISSLGATILKNIKDGIYNEPKLCFARDEHGRRVIGLPEWVGKESAVTRPPPTKTIEISAEVADMLELARLAGLGDNEAETISRLIRAGFKVLADEIDSGLSTRLSELKKRMVVFTEN